MDLLALFLTEAREKCARDNANFRKMAILLGISPKNSNVFLKHIGGQHSHLRRQVMMFKPRKIDEAYVQAQYVENMGKNKGQSSGS
jgi:hypothetical protein